MAICAFVGHEMAVRRSDEPSIAGVRRHVRQRRVVGCVVIHGPCPDAQGAIGEVEGPTGGLVEEADARRVDIVAMAAVHGGVVEDVVVAGQQRDLRRDSSEASERVGHQTGGDPRMVEQVTDDQHDVDLVLVDEMADDIDRTDAFVVVQEAARLSCPWTEMDIGRLEEPQALSSHGRTVGPHSNEATEEAPVTPSRGEPVVSTFHPVLGTMLELRTVARDNTVVQAAEQRALAEIDRLEPVFSVYDDASELCRWRNGDDLEPSRDLVALLAITQRWFAAGGGAFNPSVRVLMDLWRKAATTGRAPTGAALRRASASIETLPFRVEGDTVHRIGDCRGIELNAIAKGYIVDRALTAMCGDDGVVSAVVNLGGDLAHRGAGSLLVGIEDPRAPYDNAPPRVVVAIEGTAVATSGSARRGFHVGDRWFGHVLDPRTGSPVDHTLGASALAADAVTADVVATIAGVLDVHDALRFADSLGDVGVCLADRDGKLWRNAHWRAHERHHG